MPAFLEKFNFGPEAFSYSIRMGLKLLMSPHKKFVSSSKFTILKTTYMLRVKESERRRFIFIFRLNIVLHDYYQAHEIGIKNKEWKQKVSGHYVKNLRHWRHQLYLMETVLDKS